MSNYLLPEDDGLLIRKFGAWTVEKINYLEKYINVFETSMKDKPWRQRNYIDLFAGTGKFRIDESGKVFLGSPLIALQTHYPFTKYYFVDCDPMNIEILKTRCQSRKEINYYIGDANEKVNEIVEDILSIDSEKIPNKWSSLNLAFLDPDGLELEWQTITTIAKISRMDLIIHYSQSGLSRNMRKFYKAPGETIIDRFFGDDEWRRIYEKWRLKRHQAGIHGELIDYYKSRLHTLGYVNIFVNEPSVEPLMRTDRTRAPLYRLLFASKHEFAHILWKEVTRKDVWGQKRLL